MTRDDFLGNAEVRDFVDWLITAGESLQIRLRVTRSRFVPHAIDARISGLQNVISHYRWKSEGMSTGDWRECFERLNGLSEQLKQAINVGDNDALKEVCRRILAWGGNRRWDQGAWPFLDQQPDLAAYLAVSATAFRLADADIDMLTPPVALMNSMLTKVHALAADDGLPIYDSRVAAAVASLVELWRRSRALTGLPLPAPLSFHAVSNSRTVNSVFPEALSPGVIRGAEDLHSWASAKVRLGWLLGETLERMTSWFSDPALYCGRTPTVAMRMHAFEASLFMIGYDPRCLNAHAPNRGNIKPRGSSSSSGPVKIVDTFSSKGQQVQYCGSVDNGFEVRWGSTAFWLSPELLRDIAEEFSGETNVKLGASEDNPPDGSFGYWLCSETKLSSRHASAIGPILVNEGLAAMRRSRGFLLDF